LGLLKKVGKSILKHEKNKLAGGLKVAGKALKVAGKVKEAQAKVHGALGDPIGKKLHEAEAKGGNKLAGQLEKGGKKVSDLKLD
jgi:hypothetical protein